MSPATWRDHEIKLITDSFHELQQQQQQQQEQEQQHKEKEEDEDVDNGCGKTHQEQFTETAPTTTISSSNHYHNLKVITMKEGSGGGTGRGGGRGRGRGGGVDPTDEEDDDNNNHYTDDDDDSEEGSSSSDDDDGSEGEEDDGVEVGSEVSDEDDELHEPQCHLPSDVELTLLCLDYIRDLRRRSPPTGGGNATNTNTTNNNFLYHEGIDSNYLTIACWALNKAIIQTDLKQHGNDAFFPLDGASKAKTPGSIRAAASLINNTSPHQQQQHSQSSDNNDLMQLQFTQDKVPILPSLQQMEHELMGEQALSQQQSLDDKDHDQKKLDDDDDDDDANAAATSPSGQYEFNYEYRDQHWSNAYRYYTLGGLASCVSANTPGGAAGKTQQTPATNMPLTLGELTTAGLLGLGGRSRLEAERDMIQSPLFLQFVQAVQEKGFFDITDTQIELAAKQIRSRNSSKDQDEDTLMSTVRERIYEDRYRKVVAKFRTKLANKASGSESLLGVDESAFAAIQQYKHHRYKQLWLFQHHQQQNQSSGRDNNGNGSDGFVLSTPPTTHQQQAKAQHTQHHQIDDETKFDPPTPVSYQQQPQQPKLFFNQNAPTPTNHHSSKAVTAATRQKYHLETAKSSYQPQLAIDSPHTTTLASTGVVVDTDSHHAFHQDDLAKAEQYKTDGNAFMQIKDFDSAIRAYTQALQLCSTGPNSHVYFSNRAAAYVSKKQFIQAVKDSERSLALMPTYGKAHARLGLAHYLLGNYRHAMEAYTVALKYEPENRSSRNYLEKSAKRYAEESANNKNDASGQDQNQDIVITSSIDMQTKTSFSLVSEWEKSRASKHQHGSGGERSRSGTPTNITRTRSSTPTSSSHRRSGTPPPPRSGTPSRSSGTTTTTMPSSTSISSRRSGTPPPPRSNTPVRSSTPNGTRRSSTPIAARQQHHPPMPTAAPSPATTTAGGEATPTSIQRANSSADHHRRSRGGDHHHHSSGSNSCRGSRDVEREAEKYKTRGNSYMASRDYELAMQDYTKAISLNPHGLQSHVYYSNRAAALCYAERYQEAEADSLQSLELNPTYGKAHARLGLSRFFLQDYHGAIDAYEKSLHYDPNNAASKSYLSKAKIKLQEQIASGGGTAGSSSSTKKEPEGIATTNNNSINPNKVMEVPGVQKLAQRIMTATSMDSHSGGSSNSSDNNKKKNGNKSTAELLEDPELKMLAKQALMDPSLLAAVSRK